MQFKYNDGGRAAAGYKGQANDCVVRAVAIATERDYREVYRELSRHMKSCGYRASARDGIPNWVVREYLKELGFKWVKTMGKGTGIQVHLKEGELPKGTLIASLSRHVAAVIDGTIHDTHNPSRGGTRGVYGYWVK